MAAAIKQVGAMLTRFFGGASGSPESEEAQADAELATRVRACEGVVAEAAAILTEAAHEVETRNAALAGTLAAHEAAAQAFEADDSDANATALVATREKVPRAKSLTAKAEERREQCSRAYDIAFRALDEAKAEVELVAQRRACSSEAFHRAAAPHALKLLAALEEAAQCSAEIDKLRAASNTIARGIGVDELGAEHTLLDALRSLAGDGCAVVENDWRKLRDAMQPPSFNTFSGQGRSPNEVERDAIASSSWTDETAPRSLAYGVAVGGVVGVLAAIRRRKAKTDEERARTASDLDLMFETRGSAGVELRNASARSDAASDRDRATAAQRAERDEREVEESREREARARDRRGPDRAAY